MENGAICHQSRGKKRPLGARRASNIPWFGYLSSCAVGLAATIATAPPSQAIIIADNGVLEGSIRLAGSFPAVGGILIPLDTPNTFSLCSGSLVAPNLVLTAAHCFDATGDNVADIVASGVEFRLGGDVFGGTTQKISGTAIHLPTWNGAAAFDIALLELARSVTDVTPMQLAASPGGNQATLVGFGIGGDGTTGGDAGTGGVKRAAVNSPYFDLTIGTSLLLVDFDQPGVPDSGAGYRDGLDANSKLEGTGCGGDSGSPLVVGGPPGGLIIGVLRGPLTNADCTYGGVSIYARPDLNRAFLEDHGVALIPEPASLSLLAIALVAVGLAQRRQSAQPGS